MLISGGFAAKLKKEEKKEKKSDQDEKYDIQESVFIRWGNSLLANEPLKDFRDLCDVKYINSIAHIVTGHDPITISGNRYDDIMNLLALLGDTKTQIPDIVDCQQKAVLGIWWNLVQAFWRKFAPEQIKEDKLPEAIKQWCLEVTKDYEEVSVCDFVSSWRDGYALNCLLHNFDRKLVNMNRMFEISQHERLENAFSVAEREFKVARLLHVKDLQSENLDTKSVVTYLMTLYLSILGKSTIMESPTSSTHAHHHHIHEQSQQPPVYHVHHRSSLPTQPSTSSSAAGPSRALPADVAESPPASPSHQQVPSKAAVSVSMIIPAPRPLSPDTRPTITQQQAQAIAQAQAQQASTHRSLKQQSVDQPSESAEMRSRKSSSSSQKSAKSRRERKEALTREFENCLEQVLTWLLEAEEELSVLDPVEEKDVAIVRIQFKEFEDFMASLTDSQETVGKVLHRGQLLSSKADSEEERDAIDGQLHIVNERWEELRAAAMLRQNQLHAKLNQLQQKQISSICRWLTSVEKEIEAAGPVAATTERILEQIEEHEQFQSKVDEFQASIRSLNSFVAVVDDGESAEESVASLELSMENVGTRWQTVCAWAEQRTTQLDGLAEIVAQTGQVFDRLDKWLKDREHSLLSLKSAHHLEDDREVAEQVRLLQEAEEALEAEHGQFVRLSQLSCELVARLDSGNGAAANDVRRRLDTVTQRWDNLVARIEEHSKTLVRSGKADVAQLRKSEPSGDDSLTIDDSIKADRVVYPETQKVMTPLEHKNQPDVHGETTDTDEEAHSQTIDRFLRHVADLSREMEPLKAWTETFSVTRKPDQARKMISECQQKLVEIKDQEAKVTRLQLELEHIHLSGNLNSKQLRAANEAFDVFAKGWARIVTKISEAMNVLTGRSDDTEESTIADKIQEWIGHADRHLSDMSRLPPMEQTTRIQKMEHQLKAHQEHLSLIQKDLVKRAILKKGLEIVQKKLDSLKVTEKDDLSLIDELDGTWSSVGDVVQLDVDLTRSQKLVERAREGDSGDMVERAETRRAEMEERRRATVASRDKMGKAEKTLETIRKEVDAASRSQEPLTTVLAKVQELRERLASRSSERKEAERSMEKMLALDDNVPEPVVLAGREQVRQLVQAWKDLEDSIEDQLNCIRKEQKRTLQKVLSDEEHLLEQLEKSLTASEKASDAEECCEHLDNLENLLERVSAAGSLEEVAAGAMEESFVRDTVARVSDSREKIAARARERVTELGKAVEECERFENQLASFHQWAAVVQPLLAARKMADISALDVPDEYKPSYEAGNLVQDLSREFSHWDTVLVELREWLAIDDQRKNNERFLAQIELAESNYSELRERFSEFKRPKSFEERLERARRKLAEVENTLDDMTGIDGSACKDAVLEAKRLSQTVRDMEEEMESLENGKEELVQTGILDKSSVQGVSEKIHFAKKKNKELAVRIESTIDRLDDCVTLYDQLERQSEQVEQFLNNLEQRLEKFTREQQPGNEEVADELVSEWNRNESAIRALEDSERLLREQAVRVNEKLCEEQRRKAEQLKMRLDGWSRAVKEMEDDDEMQLLELDDLHQSLMTRLDSLKDKQPQEIATGLSLLRGDRDRLSSRARRLAAKNPRLGSGPMVAKVAQQWEQLESRLEEPASHEEEVTVASTSLERSPSRSPKREGATFIEQVDELEKALEEVSKLFDFDAAPVANYKQWEQRIDKADSGLQSLRSDIEALVSEGRRMAESGRLELDTHKALEQLDDNCQVYNDLEQDVEDHRCRLSPLMAENDSLIRDVSAMEELIDTLAQRHTAEPEVARATRNDLAERDSQLSELSHRSASLHSQLPGRSPASRDTTMARLLEKLAKLENTLSETEATRATVNATPIRTSPEMTSMSSIGPLAMEAYGNSADAYTTEDEARDLESADIPIEVPKPAPRKVISPGEPSIDSIDNGVTVSRNTVDQVTVEADTVAEAPAAKERTTVAFTQPSTMLMSVEDASLAEEASRVDRRKNSDPMREVFVNLDQIEDSLSQDEQYPLEGLEDAENRYTKYSQLLDDAIHCVDANQMTLDMSHSDHIMERIHNLKSELDSQKRRVPDLIAEWKHLHDVLFKAEKTVAQGDEVMSRIRGLPADAPADTLAELQQVADNHTAKSEVLVCESVRRMAAVLPRMVEESLKSETLKERVREMETRFRELSRKCNEARMRLETKLVDEDRLTAKIEEMNNWCETVNEECVSAAVNPLDSVILEKNIEKLERRLEQLSERKEMVHKLEAAKERLVALASVDNEAKHEIRRAVCDIAKKCADLRSDLSDRRLLFKEHKALADRFWSDVDSLAGRGEDLRRRADAVTSAIIFTPSRDHTASCRMDALRMEADVVALKEKVKDSNARHEKLSDQLEKRLITTISQCDAAVVATRAIPELSESHTEESLQSSQATVIDAAGSTGHPASMVSSTGASELDDEQDTIDDEEDDEYLEPHVVGHLGASSRGSAVSDAGTAESLPKMTPRDEGYWNSLTQLRHWLTEMERDAGLTVDLAEPQMITQKTADVQRITELIRSKAMEVIGIQDATGSIPVKQKSHDLAVDMERVMRQCDTRRGALSRLSDDAREWEMAKTAMELWLEQSEAAIESSDISMKDELVNVEKIVTELDVQKDAMTALNKKGNTILDEYPRDEAHNLSHLLSKINMRWTKFNDNIRIRRAVLEASIRSRSDFHSALSEFEEWLERMVDNVKKLETQTSNTQAIKDTAKRREWTMQEKNLKAELDAHGSVVSAVSEMGRKMTASLDQGREKTELQTRLENMERTWEAVKDTDRVIRDRLESAEQEWEKLIHNLSSLIGWIEDKSKEALAQQPVAGSLSGAMQQSAWVKNCERDMEHKSSQVKEVVANAHSYLMQHDLRPKIYTPGVLSAEEGDSTDAEQRRCGIQINADCEKVKQKWAELASQISEWEKVVQLATQRLQELDGALAECQLHLSAVEAEIENVKPVEELRLEELKDARKEAEDQSQKVDSLRIHIDDANDACGKILAADTPLDAHAKNQLNAVNQRFMDLRGAMRVRVAALKNALADFGPSSEHFLNGSVTSPWQRAISKTNLLPYYIDHTTERTQWEHPVWVEMSKELSQFNRVKFIAYRTAMKLRALQKRLCLDLVDIPMLEKAFLRLGGLSPEESPALEGMVSCLLPLFETLHAKHPAQVRSVALAVDLCINFLLNLFDPSRDGMLRVLSFKIALIVFSNAQLEEKYRYLFDLVSQEGQADQKHIALLLYDLIHIPRLVGEAAAFGGSNVEPSVRSCFESVRLAPQIPVGPFLDWLKQEPQSIVWLPVMHRLATAEFAKHSAKCNVCKMFPIIGLRYRCLRCFNLDLCQNCFFSQRTAKKHKLKHPMQEYAVPTTSSEDARDFARMVKNKLGRSKRSLGYLPVDVGEEGLPLTAPATMARNPTTDSIHQRTASISQRLAAIAASQPAEPHEQVKISDVKSPAQLINQVDQMQKDELDQLLQRLQLENCELKRELEKKKTAAASTPHLDRCISPESRRPPQDGRAGTLPRLQANQSYGRSVPSLKSAQSQSDVMDEARTLRMHKQRLEHRSKILEQQNEQLELQLQRLKKVIEQQHKETASRYNSYSVERDWPQDQRSQTGQDNQQWEESSENRATRMQSLLATVDDLGRAMESLVVSVVYDSETDD